MLQWREANMSGRCRKKICSQSRNRRLLRVTFELTRVLENALRIAETVPVTKYALFGALLLLGCTSALAQSAEDKEPKEIAVVELGAAAGWNVVSGGSNVAPTVAVEVTPIEKWLELEAGVTPIFSRHSTEWDVDLLFKKPWTLSKKVEFMAGVGPEWIHAHLAVWRHHSLQITSTRTRLPALANARSRVMSRASNASARAR